MGGQADALRPHRKEVMVLINNSPLPTWTPLPQVVARRLQKMILDGELRAGEVIPSQRQLAEQFNVSRASLREALLTLETLGLVRTEPGRGTFVTAGRPEPVTVSKWRYSSSHSMQDVFETRHMLEGQIVMAAAKVINAAAIADLVSSTDEMERCWETGDLLANAEADLSFHRTIAMNCPNQMLQSIYETVQDLLNETQRQPIPRTNPARMRESLSEHREIITALSRRDSCAAGDAMRRHIANTAACVDIKLDMGNLTT